MRSRDNGVMVILRAGPRNSILSRLHSLLIEEASKHRISECHRSSCRCEIPRQAGNDGRVLYPRNNGRSCDFSLGPSVQFAGSEMKPHRCADGSLELLGLHEGCAVTVEIAEEPDAEPESLLEMVERIRASVPDDA